MLIAAAELAEAAPTLPNLVVGCLALLIGIPIVIYRKRLYRAVDRGQEGLFGKRVSSELARLQSPFWVGAVGVFFVGMGVAMTWYGVSRLLA